MTNRTGTTYAPWTQDELDTLRRLTAAGMTAQEIASALPQRSLEAIKTRVRQLPQYPSVRQATNVVRPKAAASVRVKQLVSAIERAKQEKRVDSAYVAALRGGVHQLLRERYGVGRKHVALSQEVFV